VGHELAPVVAERLDADPLPGPLERRLGEEREGEGDVPGILGVGDHHEGGGRDAALGQDLLGPPLMEAEGEGQRVGGVAGDTIELADGRDVTLAVHAVEPFGDVEDEVGAGGAELLGERLVVFEADHFAEGGEGGGHRIDGGGLIPFGVEVGLGEIGAESAGVDGGGIGSCPGHGGRRIGFEIVRESYPYSQKILVQKRSPGGGDPTIADEFLLPS
jgi:hypothetical protein